MNWLDKSINAVAPVYGAKRQQARLQISAMQAASRSYEGARKGRNQKGWTTNTASANEDLRYDLIELRNRARDLVRNTPYGEKAMTMLASKMVGTGIKPRIPMQYSELGGYWQDFVDHADFDENTNWYGLMSLAARCMAESGEALLIEKPAPANSGLNIPLQYQLVEPDFIDSLKNVAETPSGGRIVQGIELDRRGRKVAYWLYERHPGDYWLRQGIQSKRVPASSVLHLFEVKRAGQLRGAPWLAPVMLKTKNLDDFDDAELMAKRIQACAGLSIQTTGEANLGLVSQQKSGSGSQREEEMKPGMVLRPKPGEEIKMLSPEISGDYGNYVRKHLHDIATGLRVTYEDLTGDLSQVNYSSYRAGQIAIREWVDQLRQHLLIPRLCVPVFQRVAGLAAAIHGVDTPPRVMWSVPRWPSLDLEKDVKAERLANRAGLKSLPESVADFGGDFEETINSIEESNRELDARGIVLDSDPRQRTLNGSLVNKNEQEPQGEGDGTL